MTSQRAARGLGLSAAIHASALTCAQVLPTRRAVASATTKSAGADSRPLQAEVATLGVLSLLGLPAREVQEVLGAGRSHLRLGPLRYANSVRSVVLVVSRSERLHVRQSACCLERYVPERLRLPALGRAKAATPPAAKGRWASVVGLTT